MTGDIAKAITLTTYGTAFLKDNYDISGLTLDHPSFTFTNKIEFLYYKKHFFGKPTWHQNAANPIDWFKNLKQEGCKELRFIYQPDNSHYLSGALVPDHKLAGFVGGGGNRFIQTVFENHSDFWQSRQEVTDRDSPSQKIWTVSYGRTITGQPTPMKKEYNIEIIKENLKNKLLEISLFAKKNDLLSWSKFFDSAINILESSTPLVNKKDKLIIPVDKMNLNTLQLLAGSSKAWCFGGMGSWNDIGFNQKEIEEEYDKLTSELYEMVNESYLAVANSYH